MSEDDRKVSGSQLSWTCLRESEECECDGCGRELAVGEWLLDGIESCCHGECERGGGCYRALCWECVSSAYSGVLAHGAASKRPMKAEE